MNMMLIWVSKENKEKKKKNQKNRMDLHCDILKTFTAAVYRKTRIGQIRIIKWNGVCVCVCVTHKPTNDKCRLPNSTSLTIVLYKPYRNLFSAAIVR